MGYHRGVQPRKIGLILAALIFPPAAVLIKKDAVDTDLWINVILTLLAWLPGVIHALWVIFNEPGREEASPLTRPFAEI